MTTLTSEETGTATATASVQPKATKKGRVAPRRAHVAPKKGKSGKKAKAPKKAPKGGKKAGPRSGSKTATILEMLKRPGGANAKELLKATGWMPHSLRGFISGTLGKKLGLTVTSTKGEEGERTYSIKA